MLTARNPAAIQTGYISATPQRLRFYSRILVYPSRLNEDCDRGRADMEMSSTPSPPHQFERGDHPLRRDQQWTGYCSHVPCGPTYDGFC